MKRKKITEDELLIKAKPLIDSVTHFAGDRYVLIKDVERCKHLGCGEGPRTHIVLIYIDFDTFVTSARYADEISVHILLNRMS